MFFDEDYESVAVKKVRITEDGKLSFITTINRPTETQAFRNISSYKGKLTRNQRMVHEKELMYIQAGCEPAEALNKTAVALCLTRLHCELVLQEVVVKLMGLDKHGIIIS